MKEKWTPITVTVPGKLVELACAVLNDQGSTGTLVEERRLDSFGVPDDPLEPQRPYRLQAYFPVDPRADRAAELGAAFAAMPAFRENPPEIVVQPAVAGEDWADNWKQHFSAQRFGRSLVIRPSWEAWSAAPGETVVEIDPGMAFGTGSHGTTRLCLEMIVELLEGAVPPLSILDVGTGSGILALAAAALECPRIVANDIDPQACRVAAENLAKNALEERVQIIEQPLEELPGAFDLVVANILAEENVRLRKSFVEHLNPAGELILSGILKDREDFVRRAFAELPVAAVDVRELDGWVCLRYRKA